MENKQYVVALEISSSKIVGMVGVPNPNGGIEVLGIGGERLLNCVRYGCIQNVEETKSRINRVVSKLEALISPMKITGLYVAVNGRSMHNNSMSISTTFGEESMITENAIEALKERYYSEADVQGDILEVVPCRYFVDNNEIVNPIGTYGTSVKVQFNGVVAKKTLKMNIDRAIDSQYAIKGFIVTPLAMAESVLTNEERQLGCMLVDFGAETTTVSIFRHGVLQYLATLPMGSQLITRDLMSLNVLEDAAEEIKKTSGNAMPNDSGRSIMVDGVQSLDVQNYVVARAEEIVANINEQIAYSGLSREEIATGIVLVGGGSQLNGFNRLLEEMTKLKVRFGSLPSNVLLHDSAARGIEYLQIISVTKMAASMLRVGDSCVQEPVPVIEEEVVATPEEERVEEYVDRHPEEIEEEDNNGPIKMPNKPKPKKTVEKDEEPVHETRDRRISSFRSRFEWLKDKVTDVFKESEDAYDDDNQDKF